MGLDQEPISTDRLVLAGLLFNNVAYVASACVFSRYVDPIRGSIRRYLAGSLTEEVIEDPYLVDMATIFYCLPASSIFLSMVYTESSFALFTLLGLYALYIKRQLWVGTLFFAASTLIRSNGVMSLDDRRERNVCLCTGILHIGYLGHYQWQRLMACKTQMSMIQECFKCCVAVLCSLAPFLAWQYVGYAQFCTSTDDMQPTRPWCHDSIPYIYGFVQKEYWGVGFLKYCEVKQVRPMRSDDEFNASLSTVDSFPISCWPYLHSLCLCMDGLPTFCMIRRVRSGSSFRI